MFRNCENIDLKFNKISSDIEFLQVCAENNLTPKFLNFKPYQHDIRTTKHYSNLQKSLLEKELEIIKKNLKHLKKQSERLLRSLKETVSHIDFDHLVNYLTGGNDTKLKKIKSTQNKKLFNLGLQHEVTRLNPEQLIFNYSNIKLTDDEIELLSHGLRYALPPKKIEYSRWFLPF